MSRKVWRYQRGNKKLYIEEDRQHNDQKKEYKMTKNKTLNRKLKIDQHDILSNFPLTHKLK